MLTTAFLPVYMTVKKRAGTEGASAYTSNLVSIVLVAMGAVAVLGFVFAAQMVYTQSFSATEAFDFDLTVYFFRFFVIEVVLYALSSIFSGVLNAERDYFWGQAAPIFNNFVTTASFLVYAALADKSPEIALLVLALGNPLGVAVQVILQIPPMLRHGIRLRFQIDLHDPLLKETLRIGVPSLAVVVASFVTTSVQSSSALSVVATGASITYYSRLWYTLPYSILTVPITTAMFTELSDSWAKGDRSSFTRGIVSGSGQILFFSVPFMLYLIVFSVPLISVLAAGSFTPDALAMTASYLSAYAISLPVYAVYMYLRRSPPPCGRWPCAPSPTPSRPWCRWWPPHADPDLRPRLRGLLVHAVLCHPVHRDVREPAPRAGPHRAGRRARLRPARRALGLVQGAVVGAVLLRVLNATLEGLHGHHAALRGLLRRRGRARPHRDLRRCAAAQGARGGHDRQARRKAAPPVAGGESPPPAWGRGLAAHDHLLAAAYDEVRGGAARASSSVLSLVEKVVEEPGRPLSSRSSSSPRKLFTKRRSVATSRSPVGALRSWALVLRSIERVASMAHLPHEGSSTWSGLMTTTTLSGG